MDDRIDDVDVRIIQCLQEEPRASFATIARITGVSESTVKRRTEALLADRVIYPAIVVDPSVIGFSATAIVLLKVAPGQISTVAETLVEMPEVGYLSLAVGQYDIMMYVIQPSVLDMSTFISHRIAAMPGVTAAETVMTPRFLKVFSGWRIPMRRPAVTTVEGNIWSDDSVSDPT